MHWPKKKKTGKKKQSDLDKTDNLELFEAFMLVLADTSPDDVLQMFFLSPDHELYASVEGKCYGNVGFHCLKTGKFLSGWIRFEVP